MTHPHPVHWPVDVVGKTEHVAVSGEAGSDAGGDLETGSCRAQEDLRRTERPRSEDDPVGGHELGRRVEQLATLIKYLIGHLPSVVLVGPDTSHRHPGEDLCALPMGERQVVHEHGVLCPVVATGNAVPAQDARSLGDELVLARIKGDVDSRALDRASDRLGDTLQRGQPLQTRADIGGRAQHRLCLVVIGVEKMLTFGLNGRGPGPARQLRRLGTERNVGIDQGGTTEPAADQHTDVATETKIEHGCGRAVSSVNARVKYERPTAKTRSQRARPRRSRRDGSHESSSSA